MCFFRGFWPKRVPESGFLMVNSWWIAGESWCRDGYFSALEICHGFRVYFVILMVDGSNIRRIRGQGKRSGGMHGLRLVFPDGWHSRMSE